MSWKLKIDEESKLPVFSEPEGENDLPKPIYVNPEGKEIALDAPGMYQKIIDLGKNEKDLRGQVKRLQGQTELFADIEVEDLGEWKENAIKAIEQVQNFNDKEWMDVKKVEKLKSDMKDAHQKQLDQIKTSYEDSAVKLSGDLNKKDSHIRRLMVSNKFATHPLFAGPNPKTTLPPEIAETYFGNNFRVEENDSDQLTLVATYPNGDQVYSEKNPGEPAEFEEAMFLIFDKYPGREKLMRTAGPGSGGPGGGGEDEQLDELQKLERDYAAAVEKKDVKMQIALKNRLHLERMKKKRAA